MNEFNTVTSMLFFFTFLHRMVVTNIDFHRILGHYARPFFKLCIKVKKNQLAD